MVAQPLMFPTSAPSGLPWACAAFADEPLAARYRLYRAYYAGEQRLAFATRKYRSAFARQFEAYAYNRAAPVCDAMADRLFVERFECDNEAAADHAERLWRLNRMDRRQGEVHVGALVDGDAYVIVERAPTGLVSFWAQEARNVRIAYSDEEPGRVTVAAKAWRRESDGRIRVNVYDPERLELWISRPDSRMETPADFKPESFVPYAEDVPVEGGVVPVFPFHNNARTGHYGRSELVDVIPLQDALNKTLTDQLLAAEFAAYPQRVIIGVDADEASGGQQAATLQENLRGLEAGVGRILTIASEMAKIAEFTAAALKQWDDMAERYDERISRVSKVPVHYLSLSGGFPSGRALRTAEAPFVAKLDDRTRGYGNAWENAVAYALLLDGLDPTGIEAVWRSTAPMADEDIWDLALQKRAVGLPLEQVLIETGRYAEEEAAALAAEQTQTAREIAGLATEERGGRDEEDESEGEAG
jgi:Phage portal protein, SPP1 Gp6-like